MNNLKLFFILASWFAGQHAAAVGFHCYSMPFTVVQAYEYGSSNCGKVPSDQMAQNIEQEGIKDVMCLISTGCEVVSAEAAKIPPQKTMQELELMYRRGDIKNSMLVCKGKGHFRNGLMWQTECPKPEECYGDIFYNHASWEQNPAEPRGTNVVKPADERVRTSR